MQAVQYRVISAQYSIEEDISICHHLSQYALMNARYRKHLSLAFQTDALSKSVSSMGLIGSSVAKEVGQSRLEKAKVTIQLTFPILNGLFRWMQTVFEFERGTKP